MPDDPPQEVRFDAVEYDREVAESSRTTVTVASQDCDPDDNRTRPPPPRRSVACSPRPTAAVGRGSQFCVTKR
jgi:hypothetical protein